MPQCPNCQAENPPESRFCAECGARLDQIAPQQPAAPARPTGKETIMLRIPESGVPAPPPEGQRPAPGPASDATIVVGPPAPPASVPSTPTAALPTAPVLPPGGSVYTSPAWSPPTSRALQPAAASGKSRLWLVIVLVVLLGLGISAALIAGVALVARNGGTAAQSTTPAADAGLARLPTAPPRATAAPRPTAESSTGFSKTLLRDTFDDPKRSGLTEDKTDNATYTFVDGAYAINLKTPKYLVWSPLDGSYGDAAIEVETTFDRGPAQSAAGLIFRYQDADNFYFFSISGDGSYSLDRYKKNERQTLVDWTDSPAIKGQGEVNRLRVETEGDRIRLFVNGTLLDEVSDDSFGAGQVALAVNTFTTGDATFTFDNLIVRGRR